MSARGAFVRRLSPGRDSGDGFSIRPCNELNEYDSPVHIRDFDLNLLHVFQAVHTLGT